MMKTNDLTCKWEEFQTKKGLLQRLDELHPMDFFIGIDVDGHDELVLMTIQEPVRLKSSKELKVEKHPRKTDGKWATQISSVNEKNRDIFARLCVDLVDSSIDAKSEKEGLELVTKRFVAWQRLFANLKTTLSTSVLKGMVGELLFAKNQMEPHLGWEKTMESWQGPDGADRDYVLDNTWYEIKAVSTGKNIVTISSLNQLEVDNDGFLVTYLVDESSSTDGEAFNISQFINSYRELMKNSPIALMDFEQKLISLGYMDKNEYDYIYFKCNGVTYYKVNNSFPKLVSSSVPAEIVGAKYDIDLAGINKWKVDEENLWN